ncbi:hypothetical protein N7466_003910 [Penicillium verhagenii]|uniref:uncharacterized protein n=1 Tax=Penicillium verhagenii TaxID=1562060 RepID=UPI0025454F9B|nr:uncharacterized protein N7466_003910 [Penicillium verhagenii]KAJ5934363.1 hypothetical protein N7466_003910 [Penicillium verhagenii]
MVQSFFTKTRSHRVSVRHKDKDLPVVFLPCVTTTYTPLLEADYNLHKSNSTYFTDLDASRSHLLSYLCLGGVSVVDRELVADGKRGIMAAIIGSVTTSFKKEIRIFQQYEVWSRILTWDQKWLYIVTHFVQKGSVKQVDLVTHTSSTKKSSATCAGHGSENGGHKVGRPVVFATSVSKYVFKKGRLTVAPERLLRASCLLDESKKTVGNVETGQVIEKERLRGMKYANAWAELDSLHEELAGENDKSDLVPTIGHFADIAGFGISYR